MVKTVKGLDVKLSDMRTIAKAFLLVRSNDPAHPEILEMERNLVSLFEEIQNNIRLHKWVPGRYVEFDKMERGKLRHVAYMSKYDQIYLNVWRIVVNPEIDKRLIDQTYASIKGRGQHAAIEKLKSYLRRDRERTNYCLEFDVHHCFESISGDVVMRKFRRKFKDPDVLWLTETIVYSYHNGERLPLGNVTSHPLANMVLDEVDRVVKEVMHAADYIRYLDNGYVLGKTKSYLRRVKKRVVETLERLGLKMKRNWQIYPVESRGIPALGFRLFHDFTLLSRKTKKRMKRCMAAAIEHLRSGQEPTETERGQFNSYKGHLSHCNSWRLSKGTTRLFERLWKARTWMQSPQHRTHAPSSS